MKTTCLSVALFLAAMVLPSGLLADETPEPKSPELITRTYDVAPLLVVAPRYDFPLLSDKGVNPSYCETRSGGNSDGPGTIVSWFGGLFGNNLCEVGPLDTKLKQLIEGTIRPEEPWEDAGGKSLITIVDSPAPFAIIYTTAAAHMQIAELLRDLIDQRTQTVAISISAVELEDKYTRRLALGGPLAARSEADRKALAEATKHVWASTLLIGFNGQVLSNNNQKGQSYIAAATPVVAEDSVGCQPSIVLTTTGLAVRAAATISVARKSAVVDYCLCLSRLLEIRRVPVESCTRESVGRNSIELPISLRDERAGTLTMPLDTPMIVGGGLAPARLVSADAKEGDTVNLYYLVTVRLVDTAPAAEPAETKARK